MAQAPTTDWFTSVAQNPMYRAGMGAALPTLEYFIQAPAARARRKATRYGYKARLSGIDRSRAQFKEDIYRKEQAQQQSMASRGLGFSSIAREEEGYLGRAKQRALESYAEQYEHARLEYKAYRRAERAEKRMGPIKILESALMGALMTI